MPSDPPSEFRLPFEIDDRVDPSLVTAHAGVPLVVELFRRTGAATVMDKTVTLKSRRRGLSSSQMAESLFSLWSAGGDRCEDLRKLREDEALTVMLGYPFPAPNTMREFLEGFHVEGGPLWRAGEKACVPEESLPLRGLWESNRALVASLQGQCPQREATLDVDATILESSKRTAQAVYEGGRGYQPVVVVWAEQDLIVDEEFRDGNVPAGCGNLRVIQRALKALPLGVERIFVRGDSALYEGEVLRFCEEQGIGYAVSADMGLDLRREIVKLPESAWSLDREDADGVVEWAEVPFVPEDRDHRKDRYVVRRYLAIRIRKHQGRLFEDGDAVKHFAVATNREGDGRDLIRWHRQRAGTIEQVHHVLKNELAAGALPSALFGANAAWFRLSAMEYNLLSLLRRIALPGEFSEARPKRLRYWVLNAVGKVVRHARRTLLRLSEDVQMTLLTLARSRITSLRPVLSGD